MRNKLQYFYSVLVFFGVLACSYFMVSQESTSAIPFRSIEAPPLRAEASALSPGMNQLFETERAMNKAKRPASLQKDEAGRNISESAETDQDNR